MPKRVIAVFVPQQWVKDWEGPFYVQVRDSILDYFEEQ